MADTNQEAAAAAAAATAAAAEAAKAAAAEAATKAASDAATTKAAETKQKAAEAVARVQAMLAGKAQAVKDATEAGKSAEQKLQEEVALQRADLDKTRAELVSERRSLVLDRLGVSEKFRAYAPAVDPRDPKGAAELEAWAKANPELLRPGGGSSSAPTTALDRLKQSAGTALSKVLTGERKSTLVTARNLGKLT